MIEKTELNKTMGKKEYEASIKEWKIRLGELQRECQEWKIPVMVAFEGYSASGKGVQIGKLIQGLDPRGFKVHAVKKETEDEKMHHFLWRFWTKIPSYGEIAIYDTSWYRRVLSDRFRKKSKRKQVEQDYQAITAFEKQLTDDGMLLIKLFLVIDKEEQKKRLEGLEESPETAWRVNREDWKKNRYFKEYEELNEEMLDRTDTKNAPWKIIPAMDQRYATLMIYKTVIAAMEEAVEKKKNKEEQKEDESIPKEYPKLLAKADLTRKMEKAEYKAELKKLQKRIEVLHGELYRRRIPVVIGFEGWDAAGKGGAIKRLTEAMDPRGYVVNTTAAPNDVEKRHHYLWRFWNAMPKAGHVAIFDRTWYGRVMVERIEGFCREDEWKRAYQEINEMERDLANAGAIVMKFWVQIDKDEQLKRFKEREETPEKQWKITSEDWRNREKWDVYEEAVNEMIARTDTDHAPWIIVEGNNKYYARIKVLKCVVETIEKYLKKNFK